MRGKWGDGEGESDGIGCMQVTSCHRERGTGPWQCSAGWEATSDTATAIWELTGRKGGKKKKGEKDPAEDESNISDMTLPKANLALLRWCVGGFCTSLCCSVCGDIDVITLPHRTARIPHQDFCHFHNPLCWKVFKHRPVNAAIHTQLKCDRNIC